MASGRIKGITIEIGGDTTKLQDALSDVDYNLRKTQKSLRDVNKLLKLDPKNTELLSQKQKLLTDAIGETKERLDKLKIAEKDAQRAFAEGKISEDQYNALKREIIDTEAKLKSLKAQNDSMAESLDKISRKAKKIGDSFTSAGRAMAPISAATAGVGIAAGKMALDFEDDMAKINTLLDDTKELESYRDTVMDVSSDMGIALETTADGMYQTISSLGDNGKETQKMFKTMAKSAKAGGAETADAVSLISSGMKGYGQVNEETAKKISDLAFQTAKLGVTTFPEMARSMQPLFPLSSSLNLSYEDLFGTMATLTGVTGNTSEVTTQLKAVFSGLMKPTEAMSQLIHNYGYESASAMIEAEGFSGTLDILKEATGGSETEMAKLFGSTEALTAMLALTGDQSDTFKDKLTAMSEAAGATDDALGKTHTKGEELRQKVQELSNKFTEFGGVLVDNFAPIIETILDKLTGLADAFGNLTNKQQGAIVGIMGFMIIIAPLLALLGGVFHAISFIAGGLSKLIGFVKTVGTAISAAAGITTGALAGIIAIVALVAGAIATVVMCVIKDWDHLKEEWNTFTTTVKEKLTNLKEKFSTTWSNIKTNVSEAVTTVKEKITNGVQAAKDKASSILDNLKEKFSSIFETVKTTVKNAIDKIKGFFDFDWSLPKLKLPHPKISGEFSLNPPKVPSFSVDWYKKAMDGVHMLSGATIFGSMGGKLLGGGEAGSEMVVGTSHMMSLIQQATAKNDEAIINAIGVMTDSILNMMAQYFPSFVNDKVIISERTFKRTLTDMGVVFK